MSYDDYSCTVTTLAHLRTSNEKAGSSCLFVEAKVTAYNQELAEDLKDFAAYIRKAINEYPGKV